MEGAVPHMLSEDDDEEREGMDKATEKVQLDEHEIELGAEASGRSCDDEEDEEETETDASDLWAMAEGDERDDADVGDVTHALSDKEDDGGSKTVAGKVQVDGLLPVVEDSTCI